MENLRLELGVVRSGGEPVSLPAAALLRHLFAVGSSGSGKTVLCKAIVEHAARSGIPAICIDPQGDLASVALAEGALAELIDPVVFTPASSAGVAVCADPVREIDGEDLDRWASRSARMLVSLLGYNLAGDDGDGLAVAFALLLESHRRRGGPAELGAFLGALDDLVADNADALAALVSARAMIAATRRLRRLDAPSRRALFVDGMPLDIDALLESRGAGGRTRVAIIYLNTLESQEDKELVVATLVERLYRWMLARPASELQLLFYIDEVAPYLPPVRKPACKDGLVLLLKQARKYGVGCLIASQNPGDVDYRALGQLGTWALGRLVTRQDLKKIEPSVASLAGAHTDKILGALPRLGPGQFWLLSPDSFDQPVAFEGARLEAQHRTLNIDDVTALADALWRLRFPSPAEAPGAAEPEPEPIAETSAVDTPASDPPGKKPNRRVEPTDAPGVAERIAAVISATSGLRADVIAAALAMSESNTRRHLRALLDQGRVAKLRRGREVHYLWIEGGGRADLELGAEVLSARRQLGPEKAREIAARYIRSRLFGLLTDAEELRGIDRLDVPLYAIAYREPLRPGAIGRLLGERTSHLEGTVYFDPASLELLTYSHSAGIRFRDPATRSPTEVEDLDGQVAFRAGPLSSLAIDEARWLRRRPVAEAVARFRELFVAEAADVRPVFLPLWRARFSQRRGGAVRVLLMDALRGHPVEWPEGR